MIKWTKTDSALLKLEGLLICKICNNLVNDPCSLEACDHYFCRSCVEKLVGVDSKCPECGLFAWIKDLKPNRQLANIVSLCNTIRSTIGCDGTVIQTSEIHSSDASPSYVDGNRSLNLEERSREEIYQQKTSRYTISSYEQTKPAEAPENNSIVSSNTEEINTLTEFIDGQITRIQDKVHQSSTSSQDSLDQLNSSIELFNSSCCSERNGTPYECDSDVFDSELQQNHTSIYTNTASYTSTCTSNYDYCTTEPRQGRGQKRKISATESACDSERDNKLLDETKKPKTVSGAFEQNRAWNGTVKNLKDTNDNEIHDKTGQVNIVTSSKKKSKTMHPHCNVEGNISPSRRMSSPIAGTSVMELSPAQLAKKNKRGEGLLHIAAIKGNLEDVKCLLDKGVNPNARDNAGWSPLHEACNHGYVVIAEMLLDNGAIIDLLGGLDHETPLHDAVANGKLEVVKLLVKRGAPLAARNKHGMTPIDYAVTETMREALKPLTPVCGKVLSTTQKGTIPTHLHQPQGTSKVILCTGLSTEQKEALEYCTAILGGNIVKEFSIDVTHVVTTTTNTGCCARTMKYLCSLLCGKWIVSFSWITKCLSAKLWLDESPYEIKGTSTSKMDVPSQSRINALKQLPGLFDGCQFYFHGLFVTPHKEDLTQLVKYGGATVLTREPKSESDYTLFLPCKDKKRMPLADLPVVAYHARPDSLQYRCTKYVVYDPLSQASKPPSKYKELSVVPVSWMLDCISNFEIMDIPK